MQDMNTKRHASLSSFVPTMLLLASTSTAWAQQEGPNMQTLAQAPQQFYAPAHQLSASEIREALQRIAGHPSAAALNQPVNLEVGMPAGEAQANETNNCQITDLKLESDLALPYLRVRMEPGGQAGTAQAAGPLQLRLQSNQGKLQPQLTVFAPGPMNINYREWCSTAAGTTESTVQLTLAQGWNIIGKDRNQSLMLITEY